MLFKCHFEAISTFYLEINLQNNYVGLKVHSSECKRPILAWNRSAFPETAIRRHRSRWKQLRFSLSAEPDSHSCLLQPNYDGLLPLDNQKWRNMPFRMKKQTCSGLKSRGQGKPGPGRFLQQHASSLHSQRNGNPRWKWGGEPRNRVKTSCSCLNGTRCWAFGSRGWYVADMTGRAGPGRDARWAFKPIIFIA